MAKRMRPSWLLDVGPVELHTNSDGLIGQVQSDRVAAKSKVATEKRRPVSHMNDLGPMSTRSLQAIRISTPSSDPLVTHGARG
jgi:hypothetical protein